MADALLKVAFTERPALMHFSGKLHAAKVADFSMLDLELIKANRKRLALKLSEERPRLEGGASSNSEAGILSGQLNRKRGHLPIRKLMSEVGGLVQKIKPCFMMSPLSVAQYLDPKSSCFDVIVFDEASQVRPEDAVGAILRGKLLVVVGDTRQLPPTSFFEHVTGDADEDDVHVGAAQVESILHQCKRSFPSKVLKWHYRSRHESLITVSNREFYDNQLLIYPSRFPRSKKLGLEFVHVSNGVYDRGRSSVNRIEACRVADEVIKHFEDQPEKSLGVVTFNTKQQQAIQEELELRALQRPDLESFFADANRQNFFVKNLETVQGDERDVIYISVGFGFDENGRLSKNFGPLNQEGGERRLNVLITRAKERCVVYSNFRSDDLAVKANDAWGVRSLKAFLERRFRGAS